MSKEISIRVFLLILASRLSIEASPSRIRFQSGRYSDILIAIHEDADPNLCQSIIGNLLDLFKETGSVLYNATNGKATFGSINILLPKHWRTEQCGLSSSQIASSRVFQTYESADFKVRLTHPIANSLPWTKQYKGCGRESESVYIPIEFLMNRNFSARVRGKILIQEWAKFRYGVFDEFGFNDDPFFPSCYTMNGHKYFTSCTDSRIDTISTSSEKIADNCRSLISQKKENLEEKIKIANSSLSFNPHMDQIEKFCTNETHNGMAPTKQNILCQRKSVSEVIFSHNDFSTPLGDRVFPNNRLPRPGSSPQVNIIQQLRPRKAGFVFCIEDSPNMRRFGRIDQVKQAIGQMIRLANDDTVVALYRFNGLVNWPITAATKTVLKDQNIRNIFMKKVPSTATPTPQLFGPERYARKNNPAETPLDRTFKDVLAELDEFIRWNIILVTSLPPVNLVEGLELMSKSDYALSVLTFDTSKDWLKFNDLSNTGKVVFLPHCIKEVKTNCSIISSLISDHLIELVAKEEEPRRYFHKVIDVELKALAGLFNVENIVKDGSSFILHFPVYDEAIVLTLRPPMSNDIYCHFTGLPDFDGVLANKGECPYKAGLWTYTIEGHPTDTPVNYNLRGYVETIGTDQDLMFEYAFGHDMDTELFPTRKRLPVYVAVTNTKEQPVIGAKVELEVLFEYTSIPAPKNIHLQDNGISPDITAFDGIYSAFFNNFNSNPSFHTPRVHIQTELGKSKAIVSLASHTFEAALLDPKMSSKCCGSKVPYNKTTEIGYSNYTLILPSFKTGETISPGADIIPPSMISTEIILLEDKGEYLTFEFSAPGSNDNIGVVDHYKICCTFSANGRLDGNSTCLSIQSDENCSPVESNSTQQCKVFRSNVFAEYYNESLAATTSSVLYCGFKGVDDSGNDGPISAFLVDIPMTDEFGYAIASSKTVECTSISDGCLPVNVLWGLIACIVGLIFILGIILFCWISSRKSNKKEKLGLHQSPLYIARGSRRSSFPEALRNVFANEAYVEDSTTSQLRLIASDGQLFQNTESSAIHENVETGLRRRSVSTGEIKLIVTTDTISKNSNLKSNTIDEDHDRFVATSFQPRILSAIPKADSTVTETNPPKQVRNSHGSRISGDANTNRASNTSMSSTTAGQVYASVQRFGRKTLADKPNVEMFKIPSLPMSPPWAARGTGQFSSHTSSSNSNLISNQVTPLPEIIPEVSSQPSTVATAKTEDFIEIESSKEEKPLEISSTIIVPPPPPFEDQCSIDSLSIVDVNDEDDDSDTWERF